MTLLVFRGSWLVPCSTCIEIDGIITYKILFLLVLFTSTSLDLLCICNKWLQELHGAERGETAAIFLSPLRPTFKNPADVNVHNGSQFTFFLTAPLSAFCQMIGLVPDESDTVSIHKWSLNFLKSAVTLVGLIWHVNPRMSTMKLRT
jgi:hypothetical protein